jgi:hypothetical protein
MSLRLSDLPHEILEMIVCLLNCHDICNLRLVSRAIDAASTQKHYKSFFVSNKTVKLASARVSEFADIIQHSRFASLLQDLKLTAGTQSRDQGTTSYTSQDTDILRRTIRSLCKLHRQSHQYCLRSLTAGVVEEATCSSRKFITQSASRIAAGGLAARITLRLVNDSDMPIERLHLLHDSLACGVPCCIFESPFGSAQPSSNWSRLGCLSLSLTHHARPDTEVGLDEEDDEPVYDATEESTDAGNRRVQAVVNFFSLIPNIEELNLDWYGSRIPGTIPARNTQTAADYAEKYFFDKISLAVSFQRLKHLTLRGLHTTQAALQNFLIVPTSLEQVNLAYIHLTGSFRPILDCLTSPDTGLTQFHLDDIYEQRKLIHFAIKGRPKIPFEPEEPSPGPSEVLRKGRDVTLPLEYGFASGRPLQGPQLALFRRRQREQFGPV